MGTYNINHCPLVSEDVNLKQRIDIPGLGPDAGQCAPVLLRDSENTALVTVVSFSDF